MRHIRCSLKWTTCQLHILRQGIHRVDRLMVDCDKWTYLHTPRFTTLMWTYGIKWIDANAKRACPLSRAAGRFSAPFDRATNRRWWWWAGAEFSSNLLPAGVSVLPDKWHTHLDKVERTWQKGDNGIFGLMRQAQDNIDQALGLDGDLKLKDTECWKVKTNFICIVIRKSIEHPDKKPE